MLFTPFFWYVEGLEGERERERERVRYDIIKTVTEIRLHHSVVSKSSNPS